MRIAAKSLLILFLVCSIVGTANAAQSWDRSLTCKGPLGLLVPIGIEQVPGLTAAQIVWFYNIIAVGCLMLMGACASERNLRHFAILLPLLAAMFVFFGWLQSPNATVTWSIVLGCGFLGGLIYMKESLRENWGIGGPGSTLLNIAVYLIIFQCIVGIVNSPAVGLFTQNVAPTPAEYQSIDLKSQVTELSNTGGLMQDLISYGSLFVTMAIGAIKAFISIIQAILLFSSTVMQVFPIFTDSPMVVALLVVFQLGEWILFSKLAYDMYYLKSPWVEI
jgi:hypothetical protein